MTKADLFDDKLQQTAVFFKALAHPARLAILQHLAKAQNCITGDISNELPLSRTTVNQHLTELKKSGLIKGEISGVKTYYCINKTKLQLMWTMAEDYIHLIDTCNNHNC